MDSIQEKGVDIFAAGDGSLIRVRDGLRFTKGHCHQSAPSPLIAGGCVFWMEGPMNPPLKYYRLPERIDENSKPFVPPYSYKLDIGGGKSQPVMGSKLDTGKDSWMQASPLYHEGLLYVVSSKGVLFVYDVQADALVYKKELDFGADPKRQDRPYGCGLQASPAMAGGKIFITGNFGTTILLEPGREYKEAGRNTIERKLDQNLEGYVAAPFFEGSRIFVRGQRYLYCIGGAK